MADAINQPKSSREEAAAAERSKREAELAAMAALRRPRVESQPEQGGSTQTAAAEAARRKRDAEIEELRRLKAAENEETRRRLQEKGGTLTTDMDAWRSEQLGAKDRDRKNKLDARSKLAEHHAADSDAAWRAEQMEAKERDRRQKLEAQNILKGHRGYYEGKKTDASGAGGQQEHNVSGIERLSLGEEETEDDAAISSKEERVIGRVSLEKWNNQTPAPEEEEVVAPTPPPATATPEEVEETPEPEIVNEPEPIPEPTTSKGPRSPPTYSRFDIKFSFGLIVRSSAAAEDFGNEENLRDNETLRKCMESTSKILMEQMPSAPPPDGSSLSSFPDAYYDPRLEPTVISIEEDEKTTTNDDDDVARGNKRTLVKASFPVFIRDESTDDDGKQESARMLKETKNTVFKSLRAAVSGGSFLKL
ncbi:hypothetical protein ACHAWU_005553 [Discostella pseudostelligera]|uniref:Uncharacterized protein n=1 Tax=Discostella pseudostelligera TaxID=259834 RepID=A0ABD3NBI4_9STRA